MEVISLWHCWGGMEAQVYLTVTFSSSAFFGLLFLIFLLTIPHRFSGVQVWWICWPVKHTTPCSFNQLLVLLSVWAGAPQIITDCGNLTLDFKQLGLWASPPFLQTLGPWFPNELQNLFSSEKRTLDHWATFQFFFSLAQVRRLWRQL